MKLKQKYQHDILRTACQKLGIRDRGMNRSSVFDVVWQRTRSRYTRDTEAQWAQIIKFCEWINPVKVQQVIAQRQPSQSAKPRTFVTSRSFLTSSGWRRVRMLAFVRYGNRCQCCGASPSDGVTVLNVDHVKPRATHPELALNVDNLQVLCAACNHGKGNWDSTDWR